MINTVKKKCLNCNHEWQPEDESELIPASECPKCHAIYEKVERLLLKNEYEKAEEWLNEKERGKALLKTGQQIPEEQEQKRLADYEGYLNVKKGKEKYGKYSLFIAGGKADVMSYEEFKKAHKEREEYTKTHPVTSSGKSKICIPKCPSCGSGNIKKISIGVKIFFLGPFAPLYKTFKCNNCGVKW